MNFFESTKQNKEDQEYIWAQKYRPSNLDEYVGNENLKKTIKRYLDTNDIPHLLFYGGAGTGKTTLAKIITDSIDCDVMMLNASDERGIDTIRDKIKGFASTMGFAKLKVIILDEADFLLPLSQATLRNVMESFSKHCRFILTCNYPEKIIDPIQSRCQSFQVVPPIKKDVAIQAAKILQLENIKFSTDDVVKLIDSLYPDIRKIINDCQKFSHSGELILDTKSVIETDIKLKIVDILKSNSDADTKYKSIRKLVADARISDFSEYYTYLYDKVQEYADGNDAAAILQISEATYRESLVIDKEIPFIAMIINLTTLLNK